MAMDKVALTVEINDALEQLRPYLKEDGGDMEFVDITDEGVVQVRLLGACSGCSMSVMTLKAGLEAQVKKISPLITGVVAVNADEFVL